MIFKASEFVFKAPSAISRARRILIKHSAYYPVPYQVTNSQNVLLSIIIGIRQISDADIIILEGTHGGRKIQTVY